MPVDTHRSGFEPGERGADGSPGTAILEKSGRARGNA